MENPLANPKRGGMLHPFQATLAASFLRDVGVNPASPGSPWEKGTHRLEQTGMGGVGGEAKN